MVRLRRAIAAVLVFAVTAPAWGQRTVDLHQAYLDLSNDVVIMNISAHPDDEDGAALAFYRMNRGARTYSILFTRGEGGQNEKGPELYEDLGVLRSAETVSAGRILGAEVHFLNLMDFGYSKSGTETFAKWGGTEEPLRRLVYAIRKYRPDVLFTNHNTFGGHGHHQAVAVTAIAAFDVAGDSTRFPEQVKLFGVWQPRKLYFRAFGRAEALVDVSNNVQLRDSIRGQSYLEIANDALKQHRTQGMERADLPAFSRGKSLYRLVRIFGPADGDTTSFLGGLDGEFERHSGIPDSVRTSIHALREGLSPDSLLAGAERLLHELDGMRGMSGLQSRDRRVIEEWRKELERIVEITFGVVPSVTLSDTLLVPGQKFAAQAAIASAMARVESVRVRFKVPRGWEAEPADPSPANGRLMYRLKVGVDVIPTVPRRIAQYRSLDHEERVRTEFSYLLNGHRMTSVRDARFDIARAQEVVLDAPAVWVRRSAAREGTSVGVTVVNHSPHPAAGRVTATALPGWSVTQCSFAIAAEDSVERCRLVIVPPADVREGSYPLRVGCGEGGCELTVRVFDANVKPGVHAGVVRSYDMRLENAVRELGAPCTTLTDDDLAHGDLQRFTSIVIDIRAYLVREALARNAARLLDYARDGGNLIVMYQRELEWKPEYAPYPFRVSRQRVCEEDASVDVLAPRHPLLTTPNVITEEDWKGWRQERAVYFPVDVASEYNELLVTHDTGEPPLTTGMLVARYGKGSYIYSCFVWYRQLNEVLPGSYKWLANMLSYSVTRP